MNAPIQKLPLLLLPALSLVGPLAAQASLYDIRGQAGARWGWDSAPLGDVDGDGVPEFLVGAPYASSNSVSTGAVYIVSASNAYAVRTLWGQAAGDQFGRSVAGLGDIDGDGFADLIVGAPGTDGAGSDRGALYVYSGATGLELASFQGAHDGDQLGWDVAGLGDTNFDGVGDYAASAPWDSVVAPVSGMVTVWSGDSHTPLLVRRSSQPNSLFGWSIAGAGDVNGDGRRDLLIGAPTEHAGGMVDNGRAYLYSVAAGTGAGALLWSRAGSQQSAQLGTSVAGLGDVDGNGLSDVAIGEPYSDAGGIDSGRVLVCGGANGATIHDLIGDAGHGFGLSVAGPGDVDGDGRADLIAGGPFADDFGMNNRGNARIYSGASGVELYRQYGYAAGDEMGRNVSGAGDLNGDGFDDLICAAPMSDGNGVDSGWTHLTLAGVTAPLTYCTGKLNSAGCTPSIGYTGCPSYSISNYFRIHGWNVLPGQPGILIWSRSGAAQVPFGGGTLCLAGPIVRTPVQVAEPYSAGACGGHYEYGFQHAEMIAAGLVPGDHVWAQYWMRDPGSPPPDTIGLTNAIEVEILP